MKKRVVLLSGGIDSATCLAMALRDVDSSDVLALSVNYGQKHDRELRAAEEVAKYYDVEHLVVNLDQVFQFSNCPLLRRSDAAVPHTSYADQLEAMGGAGTVSTYVPFRNGLMLSVAASLALSLGADFLIYGAHADDAVGSAYPDCSLDFVHAMSDALWEGSGGKLHLMAPLIAKTKTEVVATGLDLEAPYHLTWSCYEGDDQPCGVCGTCRDRAAAFAANRRADPALDEIGEDE